MQVPVQVETARLLFNHISQKFQNVLENHNVVDDDLKPNSKWFSNLQQLTKNMFTQERLIVEAQNSVSSVAAGFISFLKNRSADLDIKVETSHGDASM